MYNGKIVIVDDHEAVLKSLRIVLSRVFQTVITVSVPTLLPALLRNEDVDIVLLDMNFGTGKQNGGEGLFWLDRIRELKNPPEVVLMTAFADINLAVASLKRGAFDFIVKPWENEKLLDTVSSAWNNTSRRNLNSVWSESESHPGEKENAFSWMVYALLKKFAGLYAKPLPRLTPAALRKLDEMASRGDLSELQQSVERAVLLTESSLLDASDFYAVPSIPLATPHTLDEMEKQFIVEVLKEKGGNLTLAAQQLDISRQTLYNKMKKYDL